MRTIFLFILATLYYSSILKSQQLWDFKIQQQGEANHLIISHDNKYLVAMAGNPTYIIKYNASGSIARIDSVNLNLSFIRLSKSLNGSIYLAAGYYTAKFDINGQLLWLNWSDRSIKNIVPINNDQFLGDCSYIYHMGRFNSQGELIEEGRWLKTFESYTILINENYFLADLRKIDIQTFETVASNDQYTGQCFNISYDSTKIISATISSDMNIEPHYFCFLRFFDINTLDSVYEKGVEDLIFYQEQYFHKVIPTPDKGYLFIGNAQVGGPYEFQFIMKTDSLGNYQWNRTYNFGLDGEIVDVVNATDGPGYVILARNRFESYLVRVGKYGQLNNIQTPLNNKQTDKILLHPNPAKAELTVEFNHGLKGKYSIIDLKGVTCLKGDISGLVKLSVESLPAGTYILQIISWDNEVFRKNFVKQ